MIAVNVEIAAKSIQIIENRFGGDYVEYIRR